MKNLKYLSHRAFSYIRMLLHSSTPDFTFLKSVLQAPSHHSKVLFPVIVSGSRRHALDDFPFILKNIELLLCILYSNSYILLFVVILNMSTINWFVHLTFYVTNMFADTVCLAGKRYCLNLESSKSGFTLFKNLGEYYKLF